MMPAGVPISERQRRGGRRCGWRVTHRARAELPDPRARGRHRHRERRGDLAGKPVRRPPADGRSRGAAARRTRDALQPEASDDSWQLCSARATFARRPRRSHPPVLQPGDTLQLGPLSADVVRVLIHAWSRCTSATRSRRYGKASRVMGGRSSTYLSEPLATWNTWTRIAGQPVAFEPPSAGFILDWSAIGSPVHAVRGLPP